MSLDRWVTIAFELADGHPHIPVGILPILRYVVYTNPARRIIVQECDCAPGRLPQHDVPVQRIVEWRDYAAGVGKRFSSATGQVVLHDLPSAAGQTGDVIERCIATLRQQQKMAVFHLTELVRFVPTMANIQALVDYGWCRVGKISREGSVDRYELEFVPDKLEDPHAAPQAYTVGVDRATQLIQRWSMRVYGPMMQADGTMVVRHQTHTATFRYDDSGPKDIFDLDIPAGAEVVDRRGEGLEIAADAGELLERVGRLLDWDERFGDYVAVLTQNHFGGWAGLLCLCGRKRERGFQYRYWPVQAGEASQLPELAGWPWPDIRDVLTSARSVPPHCATVWDGDSAQVSSDGEDPLHTVSRNLVMTSLAGWVWEGLAVNASGDIRTRIERVSSGDRAGLVGLRIDESGHAACSPGGMDRRVTTWWLDPARGYAPVVKDVQQFSQAGQLLCDQVTQWRDFVQLPSGHWYARAWQQVMKPAAEGQRASRASAEGSLQIRQDIVPEDEWFRPAAMWPEWYRQKIAGPMP